MFYRSRDTAASVAKVAVKEKLEKELKDSSSLLR
jgi:hypothetical protein